MNIRFRESDHKYFTLEEPDRPFTSVSGLFDMVKPKFKTEEMAFKYASKPRKEIIRKLAENWEISIEDAESKWPGEFTPERIIQIWEDKKIKGLTRGTRWHKDIEQKLLQKGGKRGSSIDGEFTVPIDIKNLTTGNYIELIIPYPTQWLIGTADRVEILPNKEFIIRDWKGFSLDTEIPTLEGFKKMKNIEIGDIVFNGNGIPTKVIGVSEVHNNPCYKITFDTNETVICDFEHKWEINKGIGKIQDYKVILTAEEIYNYYQSSLPKLRVECTSLKLKDVELPIDPYVLGLWLGDGNSYFGRITNANPKIWKEIEKRGYTLGDDVSDKNSKSQDRTVFDLGSKLKKLNLINNKHIPDLYLRSSHNQRLDLLRGFMDSDGYYNKARKQCAMDTTREWQADLLIEIASSLGYKATKIKIKKSGFGKKDIPAFMVCFTPIENPFLNKNEDYLSFVKNVNFFKSKYRYIKSIEKIESVPTKCIAVEDITKTYLVTRNYIRTHNSDGKLSYSGFKGRDGKTQKLLHPLSHLDDANGIHYNVKESLYIYFLESYGYTFKDGWIDHVQFDKDDNPVGIVEYPIEYLKSEVISLLRWFKNKQK